VKPLYDRSFILAFLSQTWFVLANTLVSHYARWVEHLGGDVVTVGQVTSAGAIAAWALRPWMGQWINRIGARNMWAIGYAVFAIGSLGNLMIFQLHWSLAIMRCLLFLGAALVFTSSLTYVTQAAPLARRSEAIGVLGAGGFFGMLIGPYLGDLILGSTDRVRGDFVVLFVAAAAALIVPAILLLFIKSTDTKEPTKRSSFTEFIATAWNHWPGTILLVNVVFGVCMSVPFVFLPSYVDTLHDTSLSAVPWLTPMALFFLGYAGWGVTVRLVLRKLPDRIGRNRVLLVGLFFMATGMAWFPLVTQFGARWIWLPGMICGTGHALVFQTMTALSLTRFPAKIRGTGSALSLMMLDLGTLVGAPLLSLIAKHYSYDAMFWAISASTYTVLLVYSFNLYRLKRRSNLQEPLVCTDPV
jgi:MFS family permease